MAKTQDTQPSAKNLHSVRKLDGPLAGPALLVRGSASSTGWSGSPAA